MTNSARKLDFFVEETEKFKISFHLSNIEQKHLHDLYAVKPSLNGEESFLFATLTYPLQDTFHPVFHSRYNEAQNRYLLDKNFYNFEQGFVHARNYLQDHFNSKENLDIIIFDHGYDLPPFPGGKIKYFKSTGIDFIDASDEFYYPASFVFGGCSGDWDGDGCPEVLMFDLADALDPVMLAKIGNKFKVQPKRMPSLINNHQFRSLSGTKFYDKKGKLHLALGAIGNDSIAANDVYLINDSKGNFSEDSVRLLPLRRGGDNWACVQMMNVRFEGDETDNILAVYHDARVQHGIVDLYVQKDELEFDYFYKNKPLIEEKDSWFYRVELVKLNKSSQLPDSLVALKSRGLQNFVKKEYNFSLQIKNGDAFVDVSYYLAPLKNKEFMGIAKKFNKTSGLHDLLFFDDHGNYFYCQTKE